MLALIYFFLLFLGDQLSQDLLDLLARFFHKMVGICASLKMLHYLETA